MIALAEYEARYEAAPQRGEAESPRLILGGDFPLDSETLERTAHLPMPKVCLAPDALRRMEASRAAFLEVQEAGEAIYGVTTGFGPFARWASAEQGGCRHGAGLIAHLGAGCGAPAPEEVVRAAMLLRANTLAQGYSGARIEVVEAYLDLLGSGLIPLTPEIGSVGASGDLIPLAHIARVLMGEGEAFRHGSRMSARDALEAVGLRPLPLEGRDALALTNGTSFLTAYAALAVARAERLLSRAEALAGWMYRLLGCRAAALDSRLHTARGQSGQSRSAAAIRREASRFGSWDDDTRPLQEVYSLRCAPQILGACRENLDFARRLIETEMNGVNDNPLFFSGDGETAAAVAHGGNFMGQQVAFACDALNAALTQTGLLVDRQIDALCDPRTNGNAPLLLAWEPGPTSGLAGAQVTATALAAEMRAHAQHYANGTIPTNGGNQDIVSMGTLAARAVYAQTERLAPILAIAGIACVQLTYLRERHRAPGETTPVPAWMPPFTPYEADRPLYDDIRLIAAHWLLPTLGED